MKKDLVVLEASNRTGGWIESENVDGRIFEWDPSTLPAGEDWMNLFSELTLTPIFPALAARRRLIWKEGRVHQVWVPHPTREGEPLLCSLWTSEC